MSDDERDVTTRREFVTLLGTSTFGLALVWGALGFVGGHSHSHGQAAGRQLTPGEFRQELDAFVEEYGLDDGSVAPPTTPEADGGPGGTADGEPGGTPGAGRRPAVDVYVGARQWAFRPSTLRLSTGVPYRFNMMSFDVTHGASINLDPGSVVHRLPPETLVTDTLTFHEPGRYLLYCSYYCGQAHNSMSATLVVEDEPRPETALENEP